MIGPFDFLLLRKAQAKDLECAIDSAIRLAAARGNAPITIAAAPWKPDVIDLVLEQYRSKGWRAELVPDSRDGDFIRLDLP